MSPPPVSPPSYEESSSPSTSTSASSPLLTPLGSAPTSSTRNPAPLKGALPTGSYAAAQEQPLVHYYVQPGPGGRMISTELGPEEPAMVCLVKGHETASRFGILGILSTVLFFPWGLAVCILDRKVICKRCEQVLDPGCMP